MADRLPRGLALALFALTLAVLAIPAPTAAIQGPGQSCPDTTSAPGTSQVVCDEGKGPEGNPGGGSIDLAAVLPFVAAGGGALIALAAAFLVLRRRSAMPVLPADPDEWWTCRNCGRNNVIGSPRCYACGEWQG